MELVVYTGRSDALLFVPSPCLPPREAELTFGPLRRAGMLVVSDTPAGPWSDILRQIERHLFATVPLAQATLLMDALQPEAPSPEG